MGFMNDEVDALLHDVLSLWALNLRAPIAGHEALKVHCRVLKNYQCCGSLFLVGLYIVSYTPNAPQNDTGNYFVPYILLSPRAWSGTSLRKQPCRRRHNKVRRCYGTCCQLLGN